MKNGFPILRYSALCLILTGGVYLAWWATPPEPTPPDTTFLANAPRWERHKFPLLTCIAEGKEDTEQNIEFARVAIRRTNLQVGFPAFELESQEPRVPADARCIVLISFEDVEGGPDPRYCSTCGGSVTFDYTVMRPYDVQDSERDPNEPSYAWGYEGMGLALVSMCNVPDYAKRVLALQHQLGHILGLAHNFQNPHDIMHPQLRVTTGRELPPRITDRAGRALSDRYKSYE